ncbi:MAG: hypothetical protein HY303_20630, partial [Candidatus Wallbacteria bacterium]|nr:hypothetical protein [Candidatus Wallbacteria bacterium]
MAILVLLLAAAWVFWPALGGGKSFYYRDTPNYYYPEALLTSRAWLDGEMPLWDPRIAMGYPYHADPHSMVFYPLAALFMVLPFPLAYNAFVALHVALLGVFTFLLLRRWDLSPPAAALGGIALMFCGFTMSCTSLTTLLRGLCWTPLAMLAFDCWLEKESCRCLAAAAW